MVNGSFAKKHTVHPMKRVFLHLLFLACLPFVASAQDPVYSQFYAAPLQINPAFAGVTFAPRISINYRNQYPNWPKAYITYSLAYEQAVEDLNSGFGIMLMSDRAGDGIYRTNYATAVYGYQVRLNDTWYARFGIEAGLIQVRVDWDRLIFGDQLDPLTGGVDNAGNPFESEELRPQSLNATAFDVGAGLLFYGGPVYVGASMKHLNTPDESLIKLNDNLRAGRPVRTTVHGGVEFSLGGGNNRTAPSFISPNLLFIKQGDFAQLNIGAYTGINRFFGGIWYRHAFTNPDAVIFSLGVREGVLRIGYSYDFTLSELASVPGGLGGTHELGLTVNFADSRTLQKRRSSSRWNDCFGMFR